MFTLYKHNWIILTNQLLFVVVVVFNLIFALFLFLFISLYLKKKLSIWTRSMKVVHGPGPSGSPWTPGPCFVLTRPETVCLDLEKVVLKIKSIVMRTANNLFRKVHNYTHFKGWFTQFQRKCNILEIFHYFQYFERFRSMKKWQILKPKIVDWYLDFSRVVYNVKERYLFFQNLFSKLWATSKEIFEAKKSSSIFLKFELSRSAGWC